MYKKLLLLLALPVIVLAGDLPMKIDTTRVDTVEVKLVTYDSAIVCPQYGYGCMLGGLMPHSVKAKKWVPTLEYTTDTTYRLTEAEREYVEGISDTVCFKVTFGGSVDSGPVLFNIYYPPRIERFTPILELRDSMEIWNLDRFGVFYKYKPMRALGDSTVQGLK